MLPPGLHGLGGSRAESFLSAGRITRGGRYVCRSRKHLRRARPARWSLKGLAIIAAPHSVCAAASCGAGLLMLFGPRSMRPWPSLHGYCVALARHVRGSRPPAGSLGLLLATVGSTQSRGSRVHPGSGAAVRRDRVPSCAWALRRCDGLPPGLAVVMVANYARMLDGRVDPRIRRS